MIAASACLCGINCKYNGGNNYRKIVADLFDSGKVLPICPELFGGLQVPREPHEIIGGTGRDVLNGQARVLSSSGIDNTDKFIEGAIRTVELLKSFDINKVILKSKSPSCGCRKIYDGTFSGALTDGNGVFAELLIENGIKTDCMD